MKSFFKYVIYQVLTVPSVKIPKKLETMYYLLVPFSYSFLNNISSWGYLLLSDVVIGILKEGMDLVNYVIIVGKIYL